MDMHRSQTRQQIRGQWSYASNVWRALRLIALVATGWLLCAFVTRHHSPSAGVWWQTASAESLSPGQAVQSIRPSLDSPLHQPAKPAVALSGFQHEWQALNNCGPAVLAMNISYFGTNQNQEMIARALRPNPSDQNVRPDELARYAIEQGYQAVLRVNGNRDLLRLLVSNGIPVLIETWESDDPTNLMAGFAHFRLVTGYDDAQAHWIVHDPYFQRDLVNPEGNYEGMVVPYARADQLWRVMNRKYLVIYPTYLAPVVQSILADELDDRIMWQRSLEQAQAELDQQADDPFAWFNLGSTLYAQQKPAEAVEAFAQAQMLGLPTRMHWYQYEPLQALYEAGSLEELVRLVDATLVNATGIEELHYWKGLALAGLGESGPAHQSLRRALEIQPNYRQARYALEAGLGG
ncbi:MAG: hypothetical protein DCC55_29580 [Chloroflexi bacterium]|nr:MAG: hypothetical protein DCC55_29580 [Chloroflexota bacterium]